MTFYAQWEENSAIVPSYSEVENPKTFDAIGITVFIGIISLLGLAGTILYLKDKKIVEF